MIAISVVVGILAIFSLLLAGYGLVSAIILGYVGGGAASMLTLAGLVALRDWLCCRQDQVSSRCSEPQHGRSERSLPRPAKD